MLQSDQDMIDYQFNNEVQKLSKNSSAFGWTNQAPHSLGQMLCPFGALNEIKLSSGINKSPGESDPDNAFGLLLSSPSCARHIMPNRTLSLGFAFMQQNTL